MKKKMVIMFALLFAVVLTSYSVSGTYAKYTSKLGEATASARVAKWGIADGTQGTIADPTDLFKESYTETEDEDGSAHAEADGEKIVAPGTKGTYKFKITETGSAATPEVDYQFVINATVTDNIGRIVYQLDEQSGLDASGLENAIKALANAKKNKFEAGTSLSSALTQAGLSEEHTISWEWKFDEEGKDSDDTTQGNSENTVKLTVSVVVEQIKNANA